MSYQDLQRWTGEGHPCPAGGDGPTATAGRWRRPERVYDLLAPLARLLVWLLADLRVVGAERVPAHGGVLLAANHVSFLDPLVLTVAVYDRGRRKVVYPEGTIVPPGESRPARPGAGLVAIRANVPVLPIASQGVEGSRRRRLPRLRRRVTVVIGPPVGPVVLAGPARPASPAGGQHRVAGQRAGPAPPSAG